tara:strand:+ start:64 stop:774 length:711 start_codon:yes stop_codon:yes gene_type:complete
MTNIRLFFSESLSKNLIANLNKSQSHYINKVMRLKVNDIFSLFNSSGEWEAKINEISKGICKFKIIRQIRQKENIRELWLAFSPIKSNYLNFMMQKSTELGVTKLIPIIFERSIVRKINNSRLEKIIVEASEQSNRINVPTLENSQTLDTFLNKNKNRIELIFTDLNTENKKIDIRNNFERPICVMIGPEGDFSEKERDKILSFENVKQIKINENILRSETAAVTALSVINYVINL